MSTPKPHSLGIFTQPYIPKVPTDLLTAMPLSLCHLLPFQAFSLSSGVLGLLSELKILCQPLGLSPETYDISKGEVNPSQGRSFLNFLRNP